MLKNLKKILNFKILARDSNDFFGKVKDIYFDDENWTVRYLELDTGRWLSQSLTLISPYSVIEVDWDARAVWVNLTRKQIESGPKPDAHKPLNRHYEYKFNNHYGLPNYWASGYGVEIDGIWGGSFTPTLPDNLDLYIDVNTKENIDLHLRSMNEILGYHIQAVGDDDFGAVNDLILDDNTWGIRYIVIDTHKFWPGGKKILFSPAWVERFEWGSRKLITDFHRKVIENCPVYNPELPIEDLIEESFLSHFGKSGHWNLKEWSKKGIDYNSHNPK